MPVFLACLALGLQRQYIDRDLVYTNVEGKDLKLDAYKPKSPTGRVFISLHGGQYSEGSKGRETGKLCEFLQSKGVTCFDVDYRFRQDVGGRLDSAIFASEDDAVAAYNWVQKHAKEYGGDPGRVAIGGISAGAVTAMLTAYERKLGVKSVIDLWGAMFGHENAIQRNSPALLIVHGQHDSQIPYRYAVNLVNQAHKVSLRYRLVTNPGMQDMNLQTEIDHYSILEHVESFLRETL